MKSIDDAKGCLTPTKCYLARKKVSLLGHIVLDEDIEMDPEKIHAILALPPPSNVREVRGVLGKTKYYQRFVDILSEKMHPINLLTKKNMSFKWGQEQDLQSFCLRNA